MSSVVALCSAVVSHHIGKLEASSLSCKVAVMPYHASSELAAKLHAQAISFVASHRRTGCRRQEIEVESAPGRRAWGPARNRRAYPLWLRWTWCDVDEIGKVEVGVRSGRATEAEENIATGAGGHV